MNPCQECQKKTYGFCRACGRSMCGECKLEHSCVIRLGALEVILREVRGTAR